MKTVDKVLHKGVMIVKTQGIHNAMSPTSAAFKELEFYKRLFIEIKPEQINIITNPT